MNNHNNDPLYGKTLESIVEYLTKEYTWAELGEEVKIKCFLNDPSVASTLKFLRKTPWARKEVEELYLATINQGCK